MSWLTVSETNEFSDYKVTPYSWSLIMGEQCSLKINNIMTEIEIIKEKKEIYIQAFFQKIILINFFLNQFYITLSH